MLKIPRSGTFYCSFAPRRTLGRGRRENSPTGQRIRHCKRGEAVAVPIQGQVRNLWEIPKLPSLGR